MDRAASATGAPDGARRAAADVRDRPRDRPDRPRSGRRVVPEQRIGTGRRRLPLPAARRGGVFGVRPDAGRRGTEGRDDGRGPGARHLRGDRAAPSRSGADRAGRARTPARPCVSHRRRRDAQRHAALHAGARSGGRRLSLPLRRGHGASAHTGSANPARWRARRPRHDPASRRRTDHVHADRRGRRSVRRTVLADAPRARHARRPAARRPA